MNNGDKEDTKKRSTASEVVSMLIYIAVVLVLTYLIITFVGQRTQVIGDSMYPTLHNDDNLIVDKISYRFSEPERYDIIVFPYQYEEKTYYIKRIIGLPGETVQVLDGYVFVNGEQLDENYGREVMETAGLAADEIKLGDHEYFVLGDNRNESADSRMPDVGTIRREDIIGRAFVRIWPLNKFGILKHQ